MNLYPGLREQGAPGLSVSLGTDYVLAVLQDGRELYRYPVQTFLEKLDANYLEGRTYTQGELTFADENDAVRLKLLFQSIGVDASGAEEPKYYIGGGMHVLLDIK